MSHDPNSIPPADREFNELYRAAQGTPSSHAPNDTKLNSVKNNPSRDGLKVKHSDFFVSEVSKTIRVDTLELKRSQTTVATVSFVGEQSGFTEEIKCNPNNFEWYVKPGYEQMIRVYAGNPATHSNNTDWDQKDAEQFGAFQVLIKNIAPCSDVDVEAFICCKFKDDFNENVGASKGYDTELTGRVVCLANQISCNLSTIRNTAYGQNAQANQAYNNELEDSHSGTTGQNYGKYDTPSAQSNRQWRSLLDSNQDLLLNGVFGGDEFGLDLITGVDCVWQKLLKNSDGTSEWVDLPLTTQTNYQPLSMNSFKSADNTSGNVGQLTKWFNGGIFSRQSKLRLNVQGGFGGGDYRARVTVVGDLEDPFSCTFNTNDVNLSIVQRISPFTVQGVGYACADDPLTMNVTPVKLTRSDDGVGNSNIYYRVALVLDGAINTAGAFIKPNDGIPFQITLADVGEGYYTIAAYLVPDGLTTITPGDSHTGGYAMRYASDRVSTGWNRSRTQTTQGEWYNTAPFKRRVMPVVSTPSFNKYEGLNMSHTKLRWEWAHVPNPTGGDLTYNVKTIWHDQSGQWLTKKEWANIGGATTYQVDDAHDSPDVTRQDSKLYFMVEAQVIPPSTGLAPGDTVATCKSKLIGTNIMASRNCNTIRPTMPVPSYSGVSNQKGNDKPIFSMDYSGKNWNPGFEEIPLRANFVNISVKATGASDSTYVDFTDTIATSRNLASSVTTLGGVKYINFGNESFFATDYSFGKGKTIRFKGKTRYTDDRKSCYTSDYVTTISTIVSDAVYSWSGVKPTSYNYGSHYGKTRSFRAANFATTFTMGSSDMADLTRFGFGIGCDNLPDWAVTRVHEQDAMEVLEYKGTGLSIKQLPQPTLGGSARWPSVTLKILNSTNPHGASSIYNIGTYYPRTSATVDTVLNIDQQPGWVLHMVKNAAGHTYNGKQHHANTIMRTQFSTSARQGSLTNVSQHYENLNASARCVSRNTSPIVVPPPEPDPTSMYKEIRANKGLFLTRYTDHQNSGEKDGGTRRRVGDGAWGSWFVHELGEKLSVVRYYGDTKYSDYHHLNPIPNSNQWIGKAVNVSNKNMSLKVDYQFGTDTDDSVRFGLWYATIARDRASSFNAYTANWIEILAGSGPNGTVVSAVSVSGPGPYQGSQNVDQFSSRIHRTDHEVFIGGNTAVFFRVFGQINGGSTQMEGLGLMNFDIHSPSWY